MSICRYYGKQAFFATVANNENMGVLTMRNNSRTFSLFLILGLFMTTALADSAPGFKLPAQSGIVNLERLKGQVVYLDFWASWCAPCRKSFPWMNEMHRKYEKQGLKVIAVNLDQERAPIDKFLQKTPAEFTIAFDPGGNTAKKYNLMGMPTSFIIDRRGNIQKTHVGFRQNDKQELENMILSALAEKK